MNGDLVPMVTEDAAALVTCLVEADNFAADGLGRMWGLDRLAPDLPMWPVLIDQAGDLLYLTVGAVLSLAGWPHGRAEIAMAWSGARFAVKAELGERFGPDVDLHEPFHWLDEILIHRARWVPAANPYLHLLVIMHTTLNIWSHQDRPWSWLAERLLAG